MPIAPPPGPLAGRHVVLEPLSLDHVPGLAAAADADRSTFGWTIVPSGLDGTEGYVTDLLDLAARGGTVPFAQRRVADGALVGCTRYLDLRWYRGRAEPDEVEIGGTWLAASAQRTPINSEAKLLLLTHAFEVWGCWRVALCTDARNDRSRAAIERIGARYEGILRNFRPRMGPGETGARDTAIFAMTDADWPVARAALHARLAP